MKKILLTGSLFILSLNALAKEIKFEQQRYRVQLTSSQKSQTLRINGIIVASHGEETQSLLKFLKSHLVKGKDLKLVMDVSGGELSFVNKIYDVLKNVCHSKNSRQCQIETEVEQFRYCASACIPLYMVGDVRSAGERSNWGFHQAATMGGYLMIPFMSEYVLRQKGVNPQWLKDHARMFHSLKVKWLTPAELHGSDIINHIESL